MAAAPSRMQRAGGGSAPGGSGGASGGGPGTAFSIDSLIGPPPPRSGHLLYTGYPMFMPYRPLVLPQALAPAPLPAGLPPLAPLASFAGRLTNTFCAGLGQAVPSMVALTTALPSFAEPPDAFYGPPELSAAAAAATATAARNNPEPGGRRPEGGLEADELLPAREKVAEPPPPPPPHFSETFPSLPGKCWGRPGSRAGGSLPGNPKQQPAPNLESRHLPEAQASQTPTQMAVLRNHLQFPSIQGTSRSQNHCPALSPECLKPHGTLPNKCLSSSILVLKPWLSRDFFSESLHFSQLPGIEKLQVWDWVLGTAVRSQGEDASEQLSFSKGRAVLASDEKVVLTPDGLCECRGRGRVLKQWRLLLVTCLHPSSRGHF